MKKFRCTKVAAEQLVLEDQIPPPPEQLLLHVAEAISRGVLSVPLASRSSSTAITLFGQVVESKVRFSSQHVQMGTSDMRVQ